MNENSKDKSLIQINIKGIFYKIEQFFVNIFKKKDINEEVLAVEPNDEFNKMKNANTFIKELKNIETEILKLQKEYRNGKIDEKDLSIDQISALNKLYDKQIADLKKSNEARKQKLLQYRMKRSNS